MIIENIRSFTGQHCETTATGTLLNQLGITLSEPMVFGLGEGLGFIFWNMKAMDYPFIGGRIKPDALTQHIAANLGLKLRVKETSSPQKAWKNVKEWIDQGKTVGLKLDCYHLEYFTRPFHFAAHYTALYGYDETMAFLVDTVQQGSRVKTSLESLGRARAERGPMSSRNLSYTLEEGNTPFVLEEAVQNAILNNAREYLNPPITNIGYKGILKAGSEIRKWFAQSKNIANEFGMTAMLMEKGGTGGALFRNLYRDFLAEAYTLLKADTLKAAHEKFAKSAALWTETAALFEQVRNREDAHLIDEASVKLNTIAGLEKEAMEALVTL